MELEVGQFVRTLNGIVKIDKIQNNVIKDTKGCLHYGDFIKASHSLLGNDEEPCLIEVGDYVNGLLVTRICEDTETKGKYINLYGSISEWEEEDIKTIVTKEQFSQMTYKIGD